MEKETLTAAHNRAIQSLVTVVEGKLQEIEALSCLTQQIAKPNQMLEIVNDLSAAEIGLLQQKIESIRKTIQLFSNVYHISPKQNSLKRILQTKAAFLWEELSGASFDRLRGYGTIDESMRSEYEKYINSLTNMASEMMYLSIGHDDN